jgi:hypothetical protein
VRARTHTYVLLARARNARAHTHTLTRMMGRDCLLSSLAETDAAGSILALHAGNQHTHLQGFVHVLLCARGKGGGCDLRRSDRLYA